MIAINILMLLLLISFSIRMLLLEKQESCVCISVQPLPQGQHRRSSVTHKVPKGPCCDKPSPCPCFATCVQHQQAPASHGISSKPRPPPWSQQAKLGGA